MEIMRCLSDHMSPMELPRLNRSSWNAATVAPKETYLLSCALYGFQLGRGRDEREGLAFQTRASVDVPFAAPIDIEDIEHLGVRLVYQLGRFYMEYIMPFSFLFD